MAPGTPTSGTAGFVRYAASNATVCCCTSTVRCYPGACCNVTHTLAETYPSRKSRFGEFQDAAEKARQKQIAWGMFRKRVARPVPAPLPRGQVPFTMRNELAPLPRSHCQ